MQGTDDPVNDLERAFLGAFLLETGLKTTIEDIEHLLVKFEVNDINSKMGMIILGIMAGKKTNLESLKVLENRTDDDQIH